MQEILKVFWWLTIEHEACGQKCRRGFCQWPDLWGAGRESCTVMLPSTQELLTSHHADLEKVIHAFTQIIGYGTLGFPWLRLKVTVHSQFGYLHRGIACLRKLGSFPFESREVFLYFSHFKITHQSGKLCSAYDDISSTLVCYWHVVAFFVVRHILNIVLRKVYLFYLGFQYRTNIFQLIYKVKRTYRYTSVWHGWHCQQKSFYQYIWGNVT